MKRVILFTICGLLMVQSSLLAQQSEYSRWSLGVTLGADKPEFAPNFVSLVGVGVNFGLEVEKTFNPLWGLALGYNYLGYSYKNVSGSANEVTGVVNLNLANLLAKYRLGAWQKWNVYGRLGAGLSLYNAQAKGGTIVIPMGGSFEYNINSRLAFSLNADRRWHVSKGMGYRTVQEKAAFWVGTVGLRYKFGKKTHVKNIGADYETYYMPQYDDAPLLQKIDDQENNLRQLQDRLNKLNEDLEQAKEKVTQCCETPRVISVVAPSESQETPANNPYVTPSLSFENTDIAYEFAKYDITPSLKKGLDDLANTLKAYPTVKIKVIGHTDNTGVEAFNRDLSQKRADAVKAYLETQGIAGERIIAQGVSDTQPIASNATPEGRQKNRRIEVDFITE